MIIIVTAPKDVVAEAFAAIDAESCNRIVANTAAGKQIELEFVTDVWPQPKVVALPVTVEVQDV